MQKSLTPEEKAFKKRVFRAKFYFLKVFLPTN